MASKSSKWAILIGVNRYHESLGPLKYAVNDCRRVGEILTQGDDGFPADHVLLITDDQSEDRRPTYCHAHRVGRHASGGMDWNHDHNRKAEIGSL